MIATLYYGNRGTVGDTYNCLLLKHSDKCKRSWPKRTLYVHNTLVPNLETTFETENQTTQTAVKECDL
jgi:CTP synthase (UTP-ammonia lyase)